MRDDWFEKLVSYLHGDYWKAKIICNFIEDLTPKGFEHYIADYYERIHWFVTGVNGGMNDKGIDVKGGRKSEDGETEYLIVQCKKWNWWPKGQKDKYYIGENLIAQFYGKIADHKNSWKIRLVYATTKDVTPGAKIFCEEKGIELITYKELININNEMNLWEWIKGILENNTIEKEEIISKEYIEKSLKKQEIIQETKNEIKKTFAKIEYAFYIPKPKKISFFSFSKFQIKILKYWLIVTAILSISASMYDLHKIKMPTIQTKASIIETKDHTVIKNTKRNIPRNR